MKKPYWKYRIIIISLCCMTILAVIILSTNNQKLNEENLTPEILRNISVSGEWVVSNCVIKPRIEVNIGEIELENTTVNIDKNWHIRINDDLVKIKSCQTLTAKDLATRGNFIISQIEKIGTSFTVVDLAYSDDTQVGFGLVISDSALYARAGEHYTEYGIYNLICKSPAK